MIYYDKFFVIDQIISQPPGMIVVSLIDLCINAMMQIDFDFHNFEV